MKRKICSLVIILALCISLFSNNIYVDASVNSKSALDQEIINLLKSRINRTSFQSVYNDYLYTLDGENEIEDDIEEDYITAYSDHINSLLQLNDLIKYADEAVEAISLISNPTSDDSYLDFVTAFETAKKKVENYIEKFNELKKLEKFRYCLITEYKNSLITNYSSYDKYTYVYDVEKAYFNVGYFDKMTTEVQEKISVLSDAVDEAEKSEYQIPTTSYYNELEINTYISQYKNIKKFIDLIDNIAEVPVTTAELAAAVEANTYYNEKLSTEEKSLVPSVYIKKLNTAVQENMNVNKTIEEIDLLDDAISQLSKDSATDSDYENFVSVYNKAKEQYTSFVDTYYNVNGIDKLITNSNKLDTAIEIYEMIESIKDVNDTADNSKLSRKIYVEALVQRYNELDETSKNAIYNYDLLSQISDDLSDAYDVKNRIEMIKKNFTAEDEEEIQSIRKAYDELSDIEKIYVGTVAQNSLLIIEKQLAALNLNAANNVDKLIDKIGTVTVNSFDAINTAITEYNNLTSNQKSLVSGYNTLKTAIDKYSKLEKSVEKAKIVGIGNYTFSYAAVEPQLVVSLNSVVLTRDIDYSVTYVNNKSVGTGYIIIKGIGNYTGTIQKSFGILATSLSAANVSLSKTSYTYTGQAIVPSVKVVLGTINLTQNKDYTMILSSNKNKGTAKVTISGMGNYKGKVYSSFTIKRRSIKKAIVSGLKKKYAYTGKYIRPGMKLKYKGITLKKGKDYKLTYSKNKKTGKAKIKITGKGNFKGTKKVTFKIY